MASKGPVSHGIRIKDLTFSGVPVRVYEPTAASGEKKRGLVYFHGGGWMFGCIEDYDEVCQYISLESDTTVVSVGYRLAPEHRYPAHLDDCEVATRHFLSIAATEFGVDPCRVAVGGDSAGANLAAALCQRLSKTQDGHLLSPRAQVLIYPALQMADFHLPSYQQNHSVPLLFRDRAAFFFLQYLNGNTSVSQQLLEGKHVPAELKLHYKKWLDPDNLPPQFRKGARSSPVTASHDADVYHIVKQGLDPEISPLLAEDDVLRLTPPTFVLTCEFDVLRDDGILFQKRLKDVGVDVMWEHLSDGFHGIMSFFNQGWLTFESSQRAMDSIGVPKRLLLSHHDVPSSHYLVTLSDESYGRQASSSLPTLRSWHSDKLAWVPERSDHPIQGPPTNFGLAVTWRARIEQQRAVVPTLSMYKASYPRHPISAFCHSRHVSMPKRLSSSQHPANRSNEELALKHRPCRQVSSNPASLL